MGKQFRSPALLVVGIVEPGSYRRPQKSEFNAWLEHRALPDAGWHDDLGSCPPSMLEPIRSSRPIPPAKS